MVQAAATGQATAGPQTDRRNLEMRGRRDAIAVWCDIHPRRLAAVPDDVIVALSDRLDADGQVDGQLAELRSTAQRWEVLARTDALTGLANRRAAEERLGQEGSRAARYSHPLTLLIADVDRLKTINDVHGHLAGDEVLRAVALRLEKVVRSTDLLARWGGDEFVVICPETDRESAAQVADKLVRAARGPVEAGEATVECGISVGWATTGLDADPAKLVRAADMALYRSKQAGRDRAMGTGA